MPSTLPRDGWYAPMASPFCLHVDDKLLQLLTGIYDQVETFNRYGSVIISIYYRPEDYGYPSESSPNPELWDRYRDTAARLLPKVNRAIRRIRSGKGRLD
ncbi:MAG: hypothetical protein ACOC6F_01840 [bacterium]